MHRKIIAPFLIVVLLFCVTPMGTKANVNKMGWDDSGYNYYNGGVPKDEQGKTLGKGWKIIYTVDQRNMVDGSKRYGYMVR